MTGPVPKLWPGATVAILAGGPSLRTQCLTKLFTDVGVGKLKIISINDSWRLLPNVLVASGKPHICVNTVTEPVKVATCAMYFCDAAWWQQSMNANRRNRDNSYSFHDVIYKGWWFGGAPGFDEHLQVNALKLTGQRGLESDPAGLRHGSNSGYQAVNLAVHLGAKRILLLGYDMKMDGGRSNWHDEPRTLASPDVYAQTMLPHFGSLAKSLRQLGVEVVNCTPGSALDVFPKATLEEALKS